MADLENEILRQTNATRAANSCAPRSMDTHLLAAARLHSADMAQNGYLSHTGLDGKRPGRPDESGGLRHLRGLGREHRSRVSDAGGGDDRWLGSSGHKQNILNCSMKSIGVGIAAGVNGSLYWTQDFGGR